MGKYNIIDTFSGRIWSSYDDLEDAMDTASELNANEEDERYIIQTSNTHTGFNKAIKQGSSIVVIDCDDNDDFRKKVNIERLANKIQVR